MSKERQRPCVTPPSSSTTVVEYVVTDLTFPRDSSGGGAWQASGTQRNHWKYWMQASGTQLFSGPLCCVPGKFVGAPARPRLSPASRAAVGLFRGRPRIRADHSSSTAPRSIFRSQAPGRCQATREGKGGQGGGDTGQTRLPSSDEINGYSAGRGRAPGPGGERGRATGVPSDGTQRSAV